MGTQKMLDPIRPGEILREEFIAAEMSSIRTDLPYHVPLGISINRLSRDLSVIRRIESAKSSMAKGVSPLIRRSDFSVISASKLSSG